MRCGRNDPITDAEILDPLLYWLASRIHWPARERVLLRHLESLLAGPRPFDRVVDVGCGPGLLVPTVERLGLRYHGIDVSKAMITFLQRRFRGPFISSEVASATEALRGLVSHDIVVLNGVLHHMDQTAARETAALSKRAGAVILADHLRQDATSPFVLLMQRLDRGRYVRDSVEIDALFGPPARRDDYPIRIAGLRVWDYFTVTFTP